MRCDWCDAILPEKSRAYALRFCAFECRDAYFDHYGEVKSAPVMPDQHYQDMRLNRWIKQ